jgi:hypothetical protein
MNIKKQSLLILAIFVLSIGIVVINMGCSAEAYEIKSAKVRVNTILKGIQLREGSDDITVGDEQTSICQWYEGVIVINDPGTFGIASDEFDRWRREAGIFPYIREYTIDEDAEVVKGVEPFTVIITGTIDGASFSMKVPKGATIEWLEAPGMAID